MYNIEIEKETNGGFYVYIEKNRIYFERMEDAQAFVIKLLIETGRIGS